MSSSPARHPEPVRGRKRGKRFHANAIPIPAESRKTQNMKVVRLELTNKTQVELRGTDQHGARKAAKKTTDESFGRIRVFNFKPVSCRIKAELARAVQRKLVANIQFYNSSPRSREEAQKRGRKTGNTEAAGNPSSNQTQSCRADSGRITHQLKPGFFQEIQDFKSINSSP